MEKILTLSTRFPPLSVAFACASFIPIGLISRLIARPPGLCGASIIIAFIGPAFLTTGASEEDDSGAISDDVAASEASDDVAVTSGVFLVALVLTDRLLFTGIASIICTPATFFVYCRFTTTSGVEVGGACRFSGFLEAPDAPERISPTKSSVDVAGAAGTLIWAVLRFGRFKEDSEDSEEVGVAVGGGALV
ncbi:hypothetical protein GCK72_003470 [Caenorhabditis remanei]|uniref:Uncharacterized protein n=1 Tax=Caenorhabditis remanei TaxID=31234 RepID=A0A6A5HYA6_CAERE|nr:hypothetical protein GCK72_003470 [Caenorhabditis remanei]KAF1771643.1 hypothetical protein GCK72_003470 [Caenorhabditis remanei]